MMPAQPPSKSSTVKTTCQQVSAVLSDGPDPGADPVGYAFAQVLPLRELHTSDSSLQTAIDDLWALTGEMFEVDDSERSLIESGIAVDPARVICPSTSNRSLIDRGMPAYCERDAPLERSASTTSA